MWSLVTCSNYFAIVCISSLTSQTHVKVCVCLTLFNNTITNDYT